MDRVLSGIQPSGRPHIGNYLGAIRQHIALQEKYECFYFIADLHALTTVRNAEEMHNNSIGLTLDYLALGMEPEKTVFFRQSSVAEHAELCWILDCITTMPFLERAHAWKDAQAKQKKEVTVGLFNYPILQAADILLYKPKLVPVGRDQKQHIEMSRDIAEKFNKIFGEVFPLPEPFIKEEVATVPGTDGEKMSKSYGNIIEIFAEEDILKKQVMGVETDSTPLEKPKDTKNCNVFKLYKFFASKEELENMEDKYQAGGYGYGEAKKELLRKLLEYFAEAREKRTKLSRDIDYVKDILHEGTLRAKKVSEKTLNEVKKKIGF